MNPFVAQTLAEARVLEQYRTEALARRQHLYAAAQRLFARRWTPATPPSGPGLRPNLRG
ncbi:MAG TPA: hypothetical protein VFJ19_19100 [Nocardioidaceae bacterium]|nr:hypothetical protein [Nocardioidaceae bacterium]